MAWYFRTFVYPVPGIGNRYIYYIHSTFRSLVVSTGNREACVLACSQCSHMNKDVNVVIFVWLQFGSTANLLQQKEVNSSSSYVIKNSFEKGEGEEEEEEERQALLTLFVGKALRKMYAAFCTSPADLKNTRAHTHTQLAEHS